MSRLSNAAAIAGLAVWLATPPPATGVDAPRLAGELDAKGLAAAVAAQHGKVVVLNFWATWCVPCREEFPDLVRLEKTYRARGVSVLGVSIDLPKDMPKIEKFLSTSAPGFPNYIKRAGGDDQDFIESVDPKWGGELPFTVVYGPDGKKARVLSGKQTYASFERAVAALLK
ncbi:MAG TPA: TlpA disulfide reductase family protein [Thermoanaerobaculia bacterium]|nr:TlpA disulfide reductase family protein [Thermoanaerobaculia bacterium]